MTRTLITVAVSRGCPVNREGTWGVSVMITAQFKLSLGL